MQKQKGVVFATILIIISNSATQGKSTGDLVDETLELISQNGHTTFTDDVILVLSASNSSNDDSISSVHSNPLQIETISKSGLRPYLTTHSKTSVVYYDVSKNRGNSSMEIASSFYTQTVQTHARRVKILLVFNYTQMISENRTSFIHFLDDASNFIKNITKYRAGIALIATNCKMTGHLAKPHTIRRIGRLLQEMKKNGSHSRAALIDAILTRDMDGTFTHIGCFNKTDSESFIDVVYNVKYIPKSNSDFGFSLSSRAKALLQPLNQKVTRRIASNYENLALEIQKHYDNFNASTLPLTIAKLIKEFRSLSILISNLEKISIRKNFTDVTIKTLTTTMKINIDAGIIKAIQNDSLLLDFFESFPSIRSTDIFPDSIRSLTKSSLTLFTTITKLSNRLNTQMESTMVNVTHEIIRAYRLKLSQTSYSSSGDDQLLQEIHRDYERMNEMKIFIPSALTFNEFINRIVSTIRKLTVRSQDLGFLNDEKLPATDDFNLNSVKGKPLSFDVEAWTNPVEKLLIFLSIEQNLLEDRLRKWKQDEILEVLRVSMQERCDRAIEEIKANFTARCQPCEQ